MSRKTGLGLIEVGRKLSLDHDAKWDDLVTQEGIDFLSKKYNLHESDIALIKIGYEGERTKAPTPQDLFPFGKMKGVPYSDVPRDYFKWFWEQEWKHDWPDVIAYMKTYAPLIKKTVLDKEQQEKETQELINSLTDL